MHLLNDETIQAICWTLIHSLWQGSLLAIVGGVAIMLTKRSSSLLRYNILSGLFCVFIATACFTFAKHYRHTTNPVKISNRLSAANIEQEPLYPYAVDAVTNQKSNLDVFVNYFNEHASAVVMIWFIILSVQLIKFVANAGYVQRIKYYRTHAPAAFWKSRLQDLADSLGVKQKVTLLQSEIVKVPLMVGFLKPVILFPFQLMSQLPAEQIEAVLLHELAHIRRKDYLVNMLQNLAEIIFFFNPGVLWISSLIKDERENCCDDIAVSATQNKKEFIHALVCFQEITLSDSKYALGFPGKKNHLLNRVKRILTNNNKTLNTMEKISLASGIVIIGLITIAFKQTQKLEARKKHPISQAMHAEQIKKDTVPDNSLPTNTPSFTYSASIDGKKYKIRQENGNVKELYVDGKRIQDEKIVEYSDVISRIHKQAADEQAELDRQNDKLKLETQLLQLQKIQSDDQAQELLNKKIVMEAESLERANAKLGGLEQAKMENDILLRKIELWKKIQLENLPSDPSSKELDERWLELQKKYRVLSLQFEILSEKLLEVQEHARLSGAKNSDQQKILLQKREKELLSVRNQILEETETVNKMLGNYDYKKELTVPAKPVLPAAEPVMPKKSTVPAVPMNAIQIVPDAPQMFQSWPITNIIDDLMKDGIINSKDNIEFNLDGKVFTVNAARQPEEIHIKFKGKYIKDDKDHVRYSQHGPSISADVSNGNK